MQAIHIKHLSEEDLAYIDRTIGRWFFYFNADSYTGVTKVMMQTAIPEEKITLLRLKFADRIITYER